MVKVDLKLLLDRVEYCNGSIVQGTLMVNADKPHKCHSVVVLLSGGAKVQWSETYRDGDQDRTDYYSNSEVYIQEQSTVWIETNSPTGELPIGQHFYPFSFQLPQNLPPSYKTSTGHVKYELEARLVHVGLTSVFKSSRSTKVQLHIKEVLPEAEMQRRYGRPVTTSKSKNLKVVFFKAGSVSATVSIPRTGFSPGEVVPISIQVNNQSSRDLDVSSSLSRKDTFIASCGKRNWHTKSITRSRSYPIRPTSAPSYEDKSLVIPVDAQTTINNSSIISVEYLLTIKVSIPWSFNLDLKIPVGIVSRSTGLYSPPAGNFPQPPYNPMIAQPQQATGYSSQPPAGYPSQPAPGYPSQPAAGYPSQQAAGYPPQPATGYSSQPAAGHPSEPPVYTPQPPYPPTTPSYPPHPDSASQSGFKSSVKDDWVLVDPALPTYNEAVGKK